MLQEGGASIKKIATEKRVGRLESALGAIAYFSAKHPKAVVTIVFCMIGFSFFAISAYGIRHGTDFATGYFSAEDKEANAYREFRDKVQGMNSEQVYLELDPNNSEGITNITDRKAAIYMDELFNYVKEREPKAHSCMSVAYLSKLANYAVTQNFQIPDEYSYPYILSSFGGGVIQNFASPDFKSCIVLIIYDPEGIPEETADHIRSLVLEFRDIPAGTSGKQYDPWNNEYTDSWGMKSWAAEMNRSTTLDSGKFIPITVLYVIICLLVAFRNIARVLVGMLSWFAASIITMGAMALIGIPLGLVSLVILPILLGTGIDYSIHMINWYGAVVSKGANPAQAFRIAGMRGGVSMTICALTSIMGFAVLIYSNAPLLVQMGLTLIIGLCAMFLLAITFIPAAISITRSSASSRYKPAEALAKFTEAVGTRKKTIAAVLALAVVLSFFQIRDLSVGGSTIPETLEDGNHMQLMYNRMVDRMEMNGQEMVISRGTLCDPDAMRDLVRISEEAENEENATSVMGLPTVINTYESFKTMQGTALTLLGGVTDAIGAGQGPYANVPYDEATIRGDIEAMWDNEAWKPLASFVVDREATVTWTFASLKVPTGPDGGKQAYDIINGIIDRAGPAATDSTGFGALYGMYRYSIEAVKWTNLMAYASCIATLVLVALLVRRARAIAAIGLSIFVSMMVFYGILPLIGMRLQFELVIALAFINSLGSDYALHLCWNCERLKDTRHAFLIAGKGVLFSIITTLLAFVPFVFSKVVTTRTVMVSCIISVSIISAVTFLAVPIVYYGAKYQTNGDKITTKAQKGGFS